MKSLNKKALGYFLLVVLTLVALVVTTILPSYFNDQSQLGIGNIKQVKKQIEIYED